MIFSKAQILTLGERSKEKFILKTIGFLRENCSDWAEGKEDDEIKDYIREMIDIADDYDIRKEINVQKLIYYSVSNDLSIPYYASLQTILREEGVNEDDLISNMVAHLFK